MNYKLIAVDLDGTLLKGLNTIPKKSLMALKRFTDAGGKIVISTGRAITSARKIANKIEAYTGKKIPYIISLCGGIIYDHENNIVFEKLIDKTTTKKIADKVKELKACIWLYSKDFLTKGVYCNSILLNLYAKLYKKISLKSIKFVDTEIESRKINVYSLSKKKLTKFIEFVHKDLEGNVKLNYTKGLFFELSPLNCSKGEAIKFIAEKLDIPLNETAAIGDSGNDLSTALVVKLFGSIGKDETLKANASVEYKNKKNAVADFIDNHLFAEKQKIKLIASDLDGTMLNDKKIIEPDSIEVIQKFVPKQIPYFCLCTGRNVVDTNRILNTIKLSDEVEKYIISNNGAIVFDVKKLKSIYFKGLDINAAITLYELIKKLNKTRQFGQIGVFAHAFEEDKVVKTITSNYQYLAKVYAHNREFIIKQILDKNPAFFDHQPTSNIIETEFLQPNWLIGKLILYFESQTKRHQFVKCVNELKLPITITTSGECNLEINGQNVNKGTALKYLCKYLGIKPQETMTLGDERNDISMLKLTEWSFTFTSSNQQIKDSSRYVLDTRTSKIIIDAFKIYDKEFKKW